MLTGGSISPVGRITCSTNTPPLSFNSHALGVADTATDCGRIMSHSSKRSGRLSMQEGSRKPYSASVALRRKSPLNMPPICGTVTWLSSANTSALSGTYWNRVVGAAPGEVPRIVLDAGAGAGGFHHLEIEGGTLLQPLRFQQPALIVELV